MKKRVLTYLKPAREIVGGDRILTAGITVAKATSTELFTDASDRACVEVRLSRGTTGESVAIFMADDMVMVLE